MDLRIKVDVRGALAGLEEIQYGQLPFAISRAINKTALDTREVLLSRVLSMYKFRGNNAWVRGGRTQDKAGWFWVTLSSKTNLRAEISTNPNFTYQYLYTEGSTPGLKQARRRYLAIPLGRLQQIKIPPDLRPSAIMSSFGFIVGKGGDKFIAVRSTKQYKGGSGLVATAGRYKGLELLYLLVPLVRIQAQKILPMEELARATVARVFPETLKLEIANAVRTAR